MYKDFFELSRNPFDLTPDPTCFVSTRRHNEALASLYYGVRWHKGFVVVTGEVGTGKTLLVRCLLRLLRESTDVSYAYLFNSRLSPTEFLQYILSDFGLPSSGKNKSEILTDLGHFLAQRGAKRLTTLLIIDEAHHLSEDVLEEVRLLSNLETTEDKLLQIILVGQPELDDKLDSVELRQLKQRIALRAHLGALDADETREYIQQRLRIAGAAPEGHPIISEDAIGAIYRYSGGLPRLINSLCENALVTAYGMQVRIVTEEIIDDIAKEFRLHPVANNAAAEQKVHKTPGLLLDVIATLHPSDAEELAVSAAEAKVQ